jgi:hypothetical protein
MPESALEVGHYREVGKLKLGDMAGQTSMAGSWEVQHYQSERRPKIIKLG